MLIDILYARSKIATIDCIEIFKIEEFGKAFTKDSIFNYSSFLVNII